ncbi:hypothetical protein [Nocardioides hwasunensis]|uniref:Secreted protein n=1 Tax=Nocardioides hwasunensis TaxID=397258 RepID=A0ABR8MQ19_9ACTN|nr:hypothetical protein [Nocardioides hwasunensis]MBD3916189.1 hypothetical protein [Nocardioides hwasunensis]
MTTTRSFARSLAVAVALAGLTTGLVGTGATAASAHQVGAAAPRSGGDDDPAGDDHGGHGGDDDEVVRTGRCGAGATWKLKVKPDDGRLEVEGEVDSNVAGQRWRWTLRHNGSVSDRGAGTTTGRSGSFEVERTVVDLAGTDTIAFRAVHRGKVCRGVVNY